MYLGIFEKLFLFRGKSLEALMWNINLRLNLLKLNFEFELNCISLIVLTIKAIQLEPF